MANNEGPPDEGKLAFILQSILTIVIIDIILFVATSVVCYLIGRRTLSGFSNGLFWAGFLALGLDYLSSGRTTREVKFLAFKTLLSTGTSPAPSYILALAGLSMIVLGIVAGLLV